MAMNPTNAAGAYSAVADLARNLRGEAAAQGLEQGAGSFGDIIEAVLTNVQQNGAVTEAKAANLGNGNGDVLDLVTAVAETEVALESLVTVRDRVISAYKDILNMPI